MIKNKEKQIESLSLELADEKLKHKFTEDLTNRSKGTPTNMNNTITSFSQLASEDNEKLKSYIKEKKKDIKLLQEQNKILRNEINELRNQQQISNLPEFKEKVYTIIDNFQTNKQSEKQIIIDIKTELERATNSQ